MRTVVFDLDGTLADTSADLIAAANACFAELGLGALLDPKKDARTAFRGARAMLRLGLERVGRLDQALVEAEYPKLLGHYSANLLGETVLYPGAEEAVRTLLKQGFKVAICTNKPVEMAEELLAQLGLRDLFGALVGAGSLAVRKPDPAPYVAAVERAGGQLSRSLLVGDTETDRETARAAGVPCVLVTFGPDGGLVARLAPEALLADFEDLPGLAADLLR